MNSHDCQERKLNGSNYIRNIETVEIEKPIYPLTFDMTNDLLNFPGHFKI